MSYATATSDMQMQQYPSNGGQYNNQYNNYPPADNNYGAPPAANYYASAPNNYASAPPTNNYAPAAAVYTGGPLTAAPVQQTMMDGNQVRPSIIPSNGSSEQLIYAAYATKKTPCCHCLPWNKVSFKAFQKATYVKVYDNKIEFNEPAVTCIPKFEGCCCCNYCNGDVYVADDVRVIYFDRHIIQRVDVAGCCSPCCTHNSCCPGEAIVLRPPVVPCCKCNCQCKCCKCCEFDLNDGAANTFTAKTLFEVATACSKPHRMISKIDNPQGLVDAINRAKAASHVKYTPFISADAQKNLI